MLCASQPVHSHAAEGSIGTTLLRLSCAHAICSRCQTGSKSHYAGLRADQEAQCLTTQYWAFLAEGDRLRLNSTFVRLVGIAKNRRSRIANVFSPGKCRCCVVNDLGLLINNSVKGVQLRQSVLRSRSRSQAQPPPSTNGRPFVQSGIRIRIYLCALGAYRRDCGEPSEYKID